MTNETSKPAGGLQYNGQQMLIWIDLAAAALSDAAQRLITKTEDQTKQSVLTRDAVTLKELLYKALPSTQPQTSKQPPISFVDRPQVISWLIMIFKEIEAAADSLILQSTDPTEQFLISADCLAIKEKLHRMFVASNHFTK